MCCAPSRTRPCSGRPLPGAAASSPPRCPTRRSPEHPSPTGETLKVDYWGRPAALDVVEGPWADAFSRYLGYDVVLARSTQPGEIVFGASVSLVTTSSLARLAEDVGPVDDRQFRATMTVDTDGEPPFVEDRWHGRRLRVGEAEVEVRGAIPRCAVIGLDPVSGRAARRCAAQPRGISSGARRGRVRSRRRRHPSWPCRCRRSRGGKGLNAMPYLLRVELPDVPGSLGRVATAIGEAGGDIEAIEIVEHRGVGHRSRRRAPRDRAGRDARLDRLGLQPARGRAGAVDLALRRRRQPVPRPRGRRGADAEPEHRPRRDRRPAADHVPRRLGHAADPGGRRRSR